MVYAIKDYARRVAKIWWAIVIGFVFGLIGAFKDMTSLDIPIPAWVWWAGFVGTLFGSQFWAFWSLYKEQQRSPATTPNFTFKELLARTIGEGSLLSDENYSKAKLESVFRLAKEIREYAIQGHIQVWGRKDAELLRDSQPRTEIARDFWSSGKIEGLESLQDYKGKAEKKYPNGNVDRYWDLAFVRHQVVVLWRKPRLKYSVCSPLKIDRVYWDHGKNDDPF